VGDLNHTLARREVRKVDDDVLVVPLLRCRLVELRVERTVVQDCRGTPLVRLVTNNATIVDRNKHGCLLQRSEGLLLREGDGKVRFTEGRVRATYILLKLNRECLSRMDRLSVERRDDMETLA
jgi:hypothetical protein